MLAKRLEGLRRRLCARRIAALREHHEYLSMMANRYAVQAAEVNDSLKKELRSAMMDPSYFRNFTLRGEL